MAGGAADNTITSCLVPNGAGLLTGADGIKHTLGKERIITKPIKIIKLSDQVEWKFIVDDGDDDFTFDNVDADGMPIVRQYHGPRAGPPQPKVLPQVASLWAHQRAIAWITGGTTPLPPANIIGHSGRQYQLATDPDDEGYIPFIMNPEMLNKRFDNSSMRSLVI